jgi:hypothetical protein
MAGVADTFEDRMLDWVLNVGTPTRPSGTHLALFTANPNFETGAGGTEATGGGYARIAVTMSAASGGSTSNSSGPHDFVVGTNLAADTYTGWGIYDASTSGNLICGGSLTASRTVSASGDTIRFAATSITITLD